MPLRGKGTLDCASALKDWADADSDYATGRTVTLAHSVGNGVTARDLFDSAAHKYRAALQTLSGHISGQDKGNLELAEAAVLYYELQDWNSTARWATRSATTFSHAGDHYMHARGQALLAAAWMELAAKSASTNKNVAVPDESRTLLDRARDLLSQLATFHGRHHEPYEQALQINNIGLTYLYEGRFKAAIPYFFRSAATFQRLGESARSATAWQNRALSEWGCS